MSQKNNWVDKDGNIHFGKMIISMDDFDVIECEKCNFKHILQHLHPSW